MPGLYQLMIMAVLLGMVTFSGSPSSAKIPAVACVDVFVKAAPVSPQTYDPSRVLEKHGLDLRDFRFQFRPYEPQLEKATKIFASFKVFHQDRLALTIMVSRSSPRAMRVHPMTYPLSESLRGKGVGSLAYIVLGRLLYGHYRVTFENHHEDFVSEAAMNLWDRLVADGFARGRGEQERWLRTEIFEEGALPRIDALISRQTETRPFLNEEYLGPAPGYEHYFNTLKTQKPDVYEDARKRRLIRMACRLSPTQSFYDIHADLLRLAPEIWEIHQQILFDQENGLIAPPSDD